MEVNIVTCLRRKENKSLDSLSAFSSIYLELFFLERKFFFLKRKLRKSQEQFDEIKKNVKKILF